MSDWVIQPEEEEGTKPGAPSLLSMIVTVETSSSVTSSVSLMLVYPVAVALKVTVWVPSAAESSTAAMSKLALLCPSRIVTLEGAVASLVSSLASVTTRSPLVSVRVTVAVVAAAPAASETESAAIATVSVGVTDPSFSIRTASAIRLLYQCPIPSSSRTFNSPCSTFTVPSSSQVQPSPSVKSSGAWVWSHSFVARTPPLELPKSPQPIV